MENTPISRVSFRPAETVVTSPSGAPDLFDGGDEGGFLESQTTVSPPPAAPVAAVAVAAAAGTAAGAAAGAAAALDMNDTANLAAITPDVVSLETYDGSVDEMIADDVGGDDLGAGELGAHELDGDDQELDAPTSLHIAPEVRREQTNEIDLESALIDEDDL